MIKHEIDYGNLSLIQDEMYELMQRLYPICRSITGDGVRNTLKIIKEYIPIEIYEVPTGKKVFDWEIPKEWNITDAYIKNAKGERLIDFQKSNLHILNYSMPIRGIFTLNELKTHLYTLPEYPDWIPYRTSYYKEDWGFCLSQKQLEQLEQSQEDGYEVVIESSLQNGSLSYGELFIKGETEEEILLTCYTCHPSMCNDNLSGIVLVTFLARNLIDKPLHYSYRFLFIPETIGAITWLHENQDKVNRIKHGLVATCVGDSGKFTYKKTRTGNATIDKVVQKVLEDSEEEYEIIDFFPWGSDERQFCSPGFNLSVGSLMRTPYGRFKEYHTFADNLQFVKKEYLGHSFIKYVEILDVLENNNKYLRSNPMGEPQLSKRNLYRSDGGKKTATEVEKASFWVLNLSDGKSTLLDMSIQSQIKFKNIKYAAWLLELNELIYELKE